MILLHLKIFHLKNLWQIFRYSVFIFLFHIATVQFTGGGAQVPGPCQLHVWQLRRPPKAAGVRSLRRRQLLEDGEHHGCGSLDHGGGHHRCAGGLDAGLSPQHWRRDALHLRPWPEAAEEFSLPASECDARPGHGRQGKLWPHWYVHQVSWWG